MMEGNLDEAKRRFEEGKGISKAVQFQEGVVRADELLKELKKKTQD